MSMMPVPPPQRQVDDKYCLCCMHRDAAASIGRLDEWLQCRPQLIQLRGCTSDTPYGRFKICYERAVQMCALLGGRHCDDMERCDLIWKKDTSCANDWNIRPPRPPGNMPAGGGGSGGAGGNGNGGSGDGGSGDQGGPGGDQGGPGGGQGGPGGDQGGPGGGQGGPGGGPGGDQGGGSGGGSDLGGGNQGDGDGRQNRGFGETWLDRFKEGPWGWRGQPGGRHIGGGDADRNDRSGFPPLSGGDVDGGGGGGGSTKPPPGGGNGITTNYRGQGGINAGLARRLPPRTPPSRLAAAGGRNQDVGSLASWRRRVGGYPQPPSRGITYT